MYWVLPQSTYQIRPVQPLIQSEIQLCFKKFQYVFFLFSKKVAQPKLIAIAFYPIKMCLLDFVRQTVI